MHYTKPALTFEQQAQRLMDRGLVVPDKDTLVRQLKVVNYYRLSAYWYPFKQIDPNTGQEFFAPNTTFEKIWRRYTFDRELRLIIMDAVEYIEVAILRTRLVEHFTCSYGPFGYCDLKNFNPGWAPGDYSKLMQELDESFARSKEEFVERYKRKYTDETRLPLWMAVEVMTFGQLFTLFHNLNRSEKQKLSQQFDIYPPVLESWLKTLNYIRNVCAHHGRLWNRELSIRPFIPDIRHHPEWYIPSLPDNRRIFSVLTLLQYLIKYIVPQSEWQNHLLVLLQKYPEINLPLMGFPDKWLTCPIWKI